MESIKSRQQLYMKLLFGSAIIRLVFALIFHFEGCSFLSSLNVVTMILYIVLGTHSIKADHFMGILTITGGGMVIETIVQQLLLGPLYGYQYMYIGVIPFVFFITYMGKRRVKKSMYVAGMVLVTFMLTIAIASLINYPIYSISDASRNFIVISNILIAFTFATAFSALIVLQATSDTVLLKSQNTDIEESANIDTLTGLRNRRSVEECLDNAFMQARCERKDFTILMCDIDDFKHVNDTYGHDCGDEVLKSIASIIKNETRPEDIIIRWGGEEILIIVNSGAYAAKAVAERCRIAIEESEVKYKENTVKVTITIGGASYYQGATKEGLMKRADNNLYDGKKNGKNQVVM